MNDDRGKVKKAMYCLVEATHGISEVTGVPVETLVIAMLAAVKREDADSLIEAAKFFAPLRQAPQPAEGSSLVPTSARFEHMLTLIQRDNPQLYKKLTSLD